MDLIQIPDASPQNPVLLNIVEVSNQDRTELSRRCRNVESEVSSCEILSRFCQAASNTSADPHLEQAL